MTTNNKVTTTDNNPFLLWDKGYKRQEIEEPSVDTQDTTQQATSEADAPQEIETTQEAVETPVEELNVDVSQQEATDEPTSQEDTWAKRYADLRRLDQDRLKTIKELKDRVQALEAKPDVSNIKSDEELQAFAEEHPELYALIESIAVKKTSGLKKQLEEVQVEKKQVEVLKAMEKLKEYHPDAENIKVDPKYGEWFEKQTLRIQDLIKFGTIEDIAWGLDKYKADLGISKVKSKQELKKQEKIAAATSVSTKATNSYQSEGKKIWLESEIAKMPMKQYAKFKKEIDEAYLEGRVKPRA